MKRFFTLFIGFGSFAWIHAQQYQPVDDKSAVTFTIKNFGVNTSGSFKGLDGNIEFDKANPAKSAFDISIDAATVNTDNSSRDGPPAQRRIF